MKKPKKQIGVVQWPTDDLAAFESKLTAQRADPEHQGWERLASIMNEAARDPAIRNTDNAYWVAHFVRELVRAVDTASAQDFVMLFESKIATFRAEQKGSDPRAWVQGEWKQHRDAYDGNKSAFARDYVRRLHNERKKKVGLRRITDHWLKGM
ncbi:MAG: hypothetical protein H0V16_00040 [Burkholderiaceae bacterium]|nr:hypothetical protein [Burkholderiaceae bacterium]